MPTVFCKKQVHSRYLAPKQYLLHASTKDKQKPTTMYVDTVCLLQNTLCGCNLSVVIQYLMQNNNTVPIYCQILCIVAFFLHFFHTIVHILLPGIRFSQLKILGGRILMAETYFKLLPRP
jgi:hypothetical protein